MKQNLKELKEIWENHTNIQEQLLQTRCLPIPIITNSTEIKGEKLHLIVDEQNNTEKVLSQIAKEFQISTDDINISDGYFYVNRDISKNIDINQRISLVEEASQNHVKLSTNPIIDGFIIQKHTSLTHLLKYHKCDYSFDKNNRLQISISDLKNIIPKLEESKIQIPDTANVIVRFTPNPLHFLETKYPNIPWQHKAIFCAQRNNESSNKIYKNYKILLYNGYLSDSILNILNQEIGLSLSEYTFTFTIKESALKKYNPNESHHILPRLDKDGSSFSFITKINNTPKESLYGYFEEQFDFNLKYTRLKNFFDKFFGAENVSFSSQFEYRYNIEKFNDEFLSNQSEYHETILQKLNQAINKQDISVSFNNELGIDFNWKEEQFIDVLRRISSMFPYVNLSYFENHKCNIKLNFQNENLSEIENRLRDSFPSIHVTNDNKNGRLYFYQEYSDYTKYNQIKRSLDNELRQLNPCEYSYEILSAPETKDKYYITVDTASLQESLNDIIKDLRGCEFNFEGINIGKLIKTKFPNIIIDISSSNKVQISQLVDNYLINKINPDLTGEIEKMARLKKSFNAISSGKNLQNPNLSEFIFDASKAQPIYNIEDYTNPLSDYYLDINNNLLNKKVNESQKKAIIKTLLAEDLALIQGPPGTGKSTAIAEIMWQHIRLGFRDKKPQRILLTSETNLAVDNAIARVVNSTNNLVKPIRIGGEEKLAMEGKQFNIGTLKIWVENGSVIYNEVEEEVDEEENTFDEEISQKIILENWLSNISRRIDKSRLCKEAYVIWERMLKSPTKEIRQIVYDKYIQNCNVVGATCSSIGERNTKGAPTGFFKTYCELFGNVQNKINKDGKTVSNYSGSIKFDTIIQDESSKATPAELSLPLIYGTKNIIIGDHRQLPPLLDKEEFLSSLKYLLNKTNDEQKITEIKRLQKFVQKHFNEMEISHFQRLFESIDDSLKGIFNTQYRMHPAINEVIKQFYVEDGGLLCGLNEAIIETPDISNPQSRYHGLNIDGFIAPSDHVLWIDTKTPEMLVGTSRVNYGEVDAIHKVLSKLSKSDSFKQYQSLWENDEDKQIGLISFYGKQLKLLKELRSNFRDIPIRISTVDRFQGMERNIIIVSMVRSNCIASDKNQKADFSLYPDRGFAIQNDLGFAQSPNRLNVALSRAKRLLIIVGNSDLFRKKNIYDNVYKCVENSANGRIIKAEEL